MKTKITLILFLVGTVAVKAQLISITGNMSVPRTSHCSQLLNNGKVLVCGGNNFNLFNYVVYNSAELYYNGSWSSTGNMNREREDFTSALLLNGNVLVMGGAGQSCEIYNSTTGSWTYTDSLSFDPGWCTSVILDDNKILFVSKGSDITQLYDQSSNTWSITGPLTTELYDRFDLTKLPDGNVILVGGGTQTAQLYDVSTGTWTSVENQMLEFRMDTKSILMNNEKVLIVGSNNYYDQSSEVYDPVSNTFSLLQDIPDDHSLAEMVNLNNGYVLIYGIGDMFGFTDKKSLLKYSPLSNTWSSAGVVPGNILSAAEYTVNKIANNKILYSGGFFTTGNGANKQCYLVDEASITAGTIEITNNIPIDIYPVPNRGQFSIKTESQVNIDKIEICNSFGEVIHLINNNRLQSGFHIDISNSPAGLYFCKIYDGEFIYSGKIVKY